LEPIVSELAADWVRYTSTTWILWTEKSTLTCSEMIRPKLDRGDHFMVVAADISADAAGTLPKWVWDWMNRRRDPSTGWVALPEPVLPTPSSGLPLALHPGGSTVKGLDDLTNLFAVNLLKDDSADDNKSGR
jgi:hypothetical protein